MECQNDRPSNCLSCVRADVADGAACLIWAGKGLLKTECCKLQSLVAHDNSGTHMIALSKVSAVAVGGSCGAAAASYCALAMLATA